MTATVTTLSTVTTTTTITKTKTTSLIRGCYTIEINLVCGIFLLIFRIRGDGVGVVEEVWVGSHTHPPKYGKFHIFFVPIPL